MKYVNSHRVSHAYSKHRSRVNSNMFSFDFAVASLNKKNNEKKNMENWRYFGSQ